MSDLKCLEYCDQESPQLVRLVRDHFLRAPPGGSNYNFKRVRAIWLSLKYLVTLSTSSFLEISRIVWPNWPAKIGGFTFATEGKWLLYWIWSWQWRRFEQFTTVWAEEVCTKARKIDTCCKQTYFLYCKKLDRPSRWSQWWHFPILGREKSASVPTKQLHIWWKETKNDELCGARHRWCTLYWNKFSTI